MPELPDLVHVERVLGERLAGRKVAAARTGDPTVLRMMVAGEFAAALVGQTLKTVERRGPFMRFGFARAVGLGGNPKLVCQYLPLFPHAARGQTGPRGLGV